MSVARRPLLALLAAAAALGPVAPAGASAPQASAPGGPAAAVRTASAAPQAFELATRKVVARYTAPAGVDPRSFDDRCDALGRAFARSGASAGVSGPFGRTDVRHDEQGRAEVTCTVRFGDRPAAAVFRRDLAAARADRPDQAVRVAADRAYGVRLVVQRRRTADHRMLSVLNDRVAHPLVRTGAVCVSTSSDARGRTETVATSTAPITSGRVGAAVAEFARVTGTARRAVRVLSPWASGTACGSGR